MTDVRDNPEARRFEIRFDDGTVAFAEYRLHGDTIVFPHTVVPPEHEGQGVASRLAREALAWARERGLKVEPLCPFFASYMRKHPETQDLLSARGRELIG